ncbi:MAG: aryl-sulfate sulfotransferase [Pseudomonadota bacterium]|nr:aryl-sulfate sulfotransferase [Pseudomonadota bacterium]
MLHVLLACSAPIDEPAAVEPAEDTAAPDDVFENTLTEDGVHLAPAIVATVVNVTWSTAEPSRARVTATFLDGAVVVEEAAEGTDHAVQLVGLPPLTEVNVHVEALTADGSGGSDRAVITTGASPAWVPDLHWSAEAPDEAEPGFTLASILLMNGAGVVALDSRGRAVWAWPVEDSPPAPPVYRARLSLDRKAILYNYPAGRIADVGIIYRVALDGSTVEESGVTEGHIDFVEYTPGGYASFGWDLREIDGRKLMGDTLVERAPDGTERVVWNAWDHFSPDLSRTYEGYYPDDPEVEDWSHINGLSYDATDDAYYLTMSYQSTVVKIDRQSGEQLWSLTDGGEGDFANPHGDEFLEFPHSVQAVEGGVLVFNRDHEDLEHGCSFANEIVLDELAWEASLGWRYSPEECLLIPYLGGAERLPGGNTLLSWTNAGQLDEVTPEGTSAWRVNTSFGAAVGFTTRVATLTP